MSETCPGKCGLLSPALRTRTPAIPGEGGSLRGERAGGRVSPSRKPRPVPRSLPRVRNVGRGAASSPRTPSPMPFPASPPCAPLPARAPYLEKERDLPAGQVLLGVGGVHGCAARASGAGGEAPGCGGDRAGAGGPRRAPGSPRSPAQTRAPRCPLSPGPPRLSPGLVVSALPPPPPRLGRPHPGCGLGAAASRVPRQRGCQGRAEGAEEGGGRTEKRTPGCRLPARLPGSARRSAPPQPCPPLRPLGLRGGGGE